MDGDVLVLGWAFDASKPGVGRIKTKSERR